MGRLSRLWYRVTSTFWFAPALIVAGAVLLAFGTVEADARYVTAGALEAWPRLFGAGASASRSMLAAVAGSMITVAGTVFSITLVALSLASSQYSSRVLRNFMRDRTNQAVLGVFVGIFAYCLVVLRSIHGEADEAFVPSVAVLLGLLLGFGGIGMLVFFIHHIAESIQASRILEAVRRETCGAIERLFPDRAGADDDPDSWPDGSGWHEVRRADTTGYLQVVEFERLCDLASAHGVRLKVHVGLGDYILPGQVLLSTCPAPPEGLGDELAGACTIGRQRTLEQDVGYGIRQLVDVALKALSPSVNDTTTATMCIDSLTAILAELAHRDLRFEGCERGGTRWIDAPHPRFEDLLDQAMDQIRHFGRGNVAVLHRLLWSLESLGARTSIRARRLALSRQARRLHGVAGRELDDPDDQRSVLEAAGALLRTLDTDHG